MSVNSHKTCSDPQPPNLGGKIRGNFGSKLGIVLATAGSAVGLGNVWRFPYTTGENGGAAFILIYIGCILLLGIPGMVSEFIVGRHAQANAAKAYDAFVEWSSLEVRGISGYSHLYDYPGLLCRGGRMVPAIPLCLCHRTSQWGCGVRKKLFRGVLL